MHPLLVLLGLGSLFMSRPKATSVSPPRDGDMFAEGLLWTPVAAGSGAPSSALRAQLTLRSEWYREGNLAACRGTLYTRK
jgi:hypothetical protein